MVEPGSILMPIISDALTISLKKKEKKTNTQMANDINITLISTESTGCYQHVRYVAHYCEAHQTFRNIDQQTHQRNNCSSYSVYMSVLLCELLNSATWCSHRHVMAAVVAQRS